MKMTGDAVMDFTLFWSWFILFTRFTGVFLTLPGIGTHQVPPEYRTIAAASIALCCVVGGFHVDMPDTYIKCGLAIMMEATLGFCLGFVPSFVLAGVAVAGQVTTNAIGLGAANLIDPSLDTSIGVLARLQSLFAGLVFLFIDGHHVVIRAACQTLQDAGTMYYSPQAGIALTFLERLSATFELAVIVSAPVLVTVLISQFVLGLLTKFVPQVNVFIISLPLTIGMGLFIVAFTFFGLVDQIVNAYQPMSETLGQILGGFADLYAKHI